MIRWHLEVGRTKRTEQPFYLFPENFEAHLHILGASRFGKSKLVEYLARQQIINGEGLLVQDPTGYLYDALLAWIVEARVYEWRKIALFNPSAHGWTFGFNPADLDRHQGINPSFCVGSIVNALSQAWSGEDFLEKPRLNRCLHSTIHALAEMGLTLREYDDLLRPGKEGKQLRTFVAKTLGDEFFGAQWEAYNTLPPSDFAQWFDSTDSRLFHLVQDTVVRDIIGQTKRVIDLRRLMDDGWVVLVNLAPRGKLTPRSARLLGTLLLNDLFLAAQGRTEGSRPFYVYIDECGEYLTDDVARILDQGAKFGLRLCLIHQHLSHLREAGEAVYGAVMTNASVKIVFGGLNYPGDPEIIADMLFRGEYNLEEPKAAFAKPFVVDYVRRLFEGGSTAHGSSQGHSWGTGSSDAEGETEGPGGEPIVTSRSAGTASHEGGSYSESVTETSAWHEGFEPVIEWLYTQGFSLEEQIHKATALLVNQTKRNFVLKVPGMRSKRLVVPYVHGVDVPPHEIKRVTEELYRLSGFASPVAIARQEREERIVQFRERAEVSRDPPRNREPDDWCCP